MLGGIHALRITYQSLQASGDLRKLIPLRTDRNYLLKRADAIRFIKDIALNCSSGQDSV